jgi:cation-transporting ATPase E
MHDTIRPEARAVLDQFRALGVRIVIISGDDPQAVAALMTQVGFSEQQQVVHGHEIDALADDALAMLVAQAAIFGRVTPRQKARIITALRQNGATPAMVGDGMNDILAMKQSTLALAMQTSNSAVRAVADVVLLNDNLAVLPALLHAGQRVISSMQAVLNHFLVRVSLSTVLLLTGMLLGKIIWLPFESAFLALCGVVIPALVIVSRTHTPASLRDRTRMWRDAAWLSGMGIGAVVITHFFFASSQSHILIGFAIVGLWIRLLWAYKSPQ